MAMAVVDMWAAISQLIDDSALLTAQQLGVLSQVVTYTPAAGVDTDQLRVAVAMLGAAIAAKQGTGDVEAEYLVVHVT